MSWRWRARRAIRPLRREHEAAYLDHVERDFIEKSLTRERSRANRRLAEAVVAWHEWSFEKGGRPPHEWLPED